MKPILMLVLAILCIGIVYAGINAVYEIKDRDFKFKIEKDQNIDLSNCTDISMTNARYGTYQTTCNNITQEIEITQEELLEIVLQLREEVKILQQNATDVKNRIDKIDKNVTKI